jgi:hypothetical protein
VYSLDTLKKVFEDAKKVKMAMKELQENEFINKPLLKLFERDIISLIYTACHLRYSYWKDTLILPGGVVNRDVLDRSKSAGMTKDDIRMFQRFLVDKEHNYRLDDLLAQLDTTRKLMNLSIDKKKYENERDADRLKTSAIHNILNTYIRESKDCFSTTNMIKTVVADITVNKLPVESSLYKFFGVDSKDDITGKLYNRIASQYIEKTDEQLENTRTRSDINTSVIIDMVLEFLTEKTMS